MPHNAYGVWYPDNFLQPGVPAHIGGPPAGTPMYITPTKPNPSNPMDPGYLQPIQQPTVNHPQPGGDFFALGVDGWLKLDQQQNPMPFPPPPGQEGSPGPLFPRLGLFSFENIFEGLNFDFSLDLFSDSAPIGDLFNFNMEQFNFDFKFDDFDFDFKFDDLDLNFDITGFEHGLLGGIFEGIGFLFDPAGTVENRLEKNWDLGFGHILGQLDNAPWNWNLKP